MTEGFPEPGRSALRAWYRAVGRHNLPWRATRDPYAVLVSEVMLQQTQVDRVIPYWHGWMAHWPNASSLAEATSAEVIQAWAGLGYNRRALNLHRAAKAVVEVHGGDVATDPAELRRLPGVGAYTANAVACFAGERRVSVLDTNIARVVARVVLGVDRTATNDSATYAAAESALPVRDARGWNLALMDLGAGVCTARRPACDECPLERWCAWNRAGRPPGERATATGTTPFAETARYGRGRVVEALRRQPLTLGTLLGVAGDAHAERIPGYLAALQRDGLVEEFAPGAWRLPGDARAATEG